MVEGVNMKVTSLFYISGFCSFLALGNTCSLSEYKTADGECCPMCSIGTMVLYDCTGDFSTTCKPCIPGTFMSEPSSLHKCFPCKHCNESQGLYILNKCTTIRDTICDVLDGYHCTEYSNSQCSRAVKHSVCAPGQETKTLGTKTSDTECGNCTFGFSSSGLNCKKTDACAWAEYEINGECCPMCAPGNHVHWHCTEDTSTTCVPCSALTYIDEPSGLDKCFPCSVCDDQQGLRVNRTCTHSTDTVCEPLEGFYCIEQNKGSCRFAVKHSECDPGQYIRQAGTAFTDTDCGNCAEGTYSNGTFTTCQPHSKCETEGLQEIKPGSMSSDTECGHSTRR
ncbi:tumor necrosis factor receptor superfamily member 5-like isoform X1 [Chanodichthys erythropterus]|uniref:tumor necrosis factor receptor superfamily member 5-like isoform X1 n=2 Tax=Chanodichthys erythropterus TaxID=933992 RepID=UPI00351E1D56